MSLKKGDETIYTGYRNLFWMYGHSRAELIYIPLVSGQKRDGNIIQSQGYTAKYRGHTLEHNICLELTILYLFGAHKTLDSDFIPIQSHSKFKIIADTYQMATLSLFEDYSVDSFSKSFLANKLKVDYNSLDKLVLSHLEKLKLIKIQAWIHHNKGRRSVIGSRR